MWRVQCGEDCTKTSEYLRRDAGIAGRLGCVSPCTSPGTFSALGVIHSLPRVCSGRGKPLHRPRSVDGVRVGHEKIRNRRNTKLNTNTMQVQDEADCIEGIYWDWMYNGICIVGVYCDWAYTAKCIVGVLC